jgi:tryptophan synthase beta chain
MVKVSYQQKPYRRMMMETWGASVTPSPSDQTEAGRMILAQDPNSPGSLGIAISEAVNDAVKREDTRYSLGSVLNHVILHQTVVGLETKAQLKKIGVEPDVLIGCVGGGSNFAGFCFPFFPEKKQGKKVRFVAVEPTACPTLTKGLYRYDFGDTAQMAPIVKMYTLGHTFVPPGIHAGGLRYHGDAPLLCLLYDEGFVEAVAYPQNPVFEAAMLFARTEGTIPAPETAHAIRAAVDEAIKCREKKEGKVIVFNFSGHGHFDLAAYDMYLSKKLEDFEYPEEKIQEALHHLPEVKE